MKLLLVVGQDEHDIREPLFGSIAKWNHPAGKQGTEGEDREESSKQTHARDLQPGSTPSEQFGAECRTTKNLAGHK
jgi:hypothetical protein